jgi:hypothetical protein
LNDLFLKRRLFLLQLWACKQVCIETIGSNIKLKK